MARCHGSHSVKVSHNARYKIWQSMRVQKTFTVAELMATSGAKLDNTKLYVKALRRTEFLRVVRPRQSGRKGGDAVYRLIRNTGPKPPRVRENKTVYDANTGAVHEREDDMFDIGRNHFPHATMNGPTQNLGVLRMQRRVLA